LLGFVALAGGPPRVGLRPPHYGPPARAISGGNDFTEAMLHKHDVARLNQAARATLREAGRLGADMAEIETETGRLGLAIGDRVMATRNEGALRNGQLGTVVAIDHGEPGGHRLTVRLDGAGADRIIDTAQYPPGKARLSGKFSNRCHALWVTWHDQLFHRQTPAALRARTASAGFAARGKAAI